MIELVVRLVFSLAVVVGMLLLLAKFSAKRFRGGSGSLVQVVQRQPLSRTSSVAVVTVGSRVLVLGTTEQQVQLLTELDPDELDVPLLPLASSEVVAEATTPDDVRPRLVGTSSRVAVRATTSDDVREGALSGSVLSTQTWKQAFAAATAGAGGRHRAAS
ncbi:MAG TPA: flagellar biosynthetic protein FliO [Marmoricola sp.]|nr:flagellar biosynthetic protein FliO [Marmoricola sp.]